MQEIENKGGCVEKDARPYEGEVHIEGVNEQGKNVIMHITCSYDSAGQYEGYPTWITYVYEDQEQFDFLYRFSTD